MSTEELLQAYNYFRNQGVRNINCGMLRSIGKTESLKTLIQQNHIISVEDVVLVPDRSFTRDYSEINVELITVDRTEGGLSWSYRFRGRRPTAFYADEVPDAERLVNEFHDSNFVFVAGFYSSQSAVTNFNELGYSSPGRSGYRGVSGYDGASGYRGVSGFSGTLEGVEERRRLDLASIENTLKTIDKITSLSENELNKNNKLKFIMQQKEK
jgi:hypothetical protein